LLVAVALDLLKTPLLVVL
jgi:hypothetical protein